VLDQRAHEKCGSSLTSHGWRCEQTLPACESLLCA
jgi:hypothetical protein